MIRTALASFGTRRPLAVAAAMAFCAVSLPQARADQGAPAQGIRTTLVALAAADAVTPLATANDLAAARPASSVLLKPDNANAMAAIRTVSVRRSEPVDTYRRVTYRPLRDPFFLAVGIAY